MEQSILDCEQFCFCKLQLQFHFNYCGKKPITMFESSCLETDHIIQR